MFYTKNMSKISPIDIRVAVLTFPFMNKGGKAPIGNSKVELSTIDSISHIALAPYAERIGDLFRTKPKSSFEQPISKRPFLVRKGEFLLINWIESIKTFYKNWMVEEELQPYPPRAILVPKLPSPSFEAPRPSRYFWHPASPIAQDVYADPCLMRDSTEELPLPTPQSETLCAHARNLPLKGLLRKDKQGLVYLELSTDYIAQLFPLLNAIDAESVPLSQVAPTPAHIPVMTPHEYLTAKRWGKIKELNQEFSFEIRGCFSVKPQLIPEMNKMYYLMIHSLELEGLREKYLLPRTIGTHSFHLVIGFQKQEKSSSRQPETFRLNVSCFAA